MPLVAGTRIGPHEILGPLGAGGMGEVYRATDTRLKRQAAVKILPSTSPAASCRTGSRRKRHRVHPRPTPDAFGIYVLPMDGSSARKPSLFVSAVRCTAG